MQGGNIMDDDDAKLRKAVAAFDWLVRVYAPAFLRLAKLDEQATTLAGLPKILKVDESTYVYVRTRDIWKDIRKRRRELQGRTFGLPNDNAWNIVVKAFEEAAIQPGKLIIDDIPISMRGIASEIWAVADGAAEIAIVSADVTTEAVSEMDRNLEQQLTALIKDQS
jgi:hypothetical protein